MKISRNIFIIHGTGGYPEENWFPWLKEKLEPFGCNVIIPQFPTPKNQTPKEWFKILKKYKKYLDKNTILIGHSLGGTFILRILEKIDFPIKAAFFVATPIGIPPTKFLKEDNPFTEPEPNWEKIKNNCEKIAVYHSDTDPFVCRENGKKLAKNLGVKLKQIHNAGHFNKKAGYTKFELLLKEITKIL